MDDTLCEVFQIPELINRLKSLSPFVAISGAQVSQDVRFLVHEKAYCILFQAFPILFGCPDLWSAPTASSVMPGPSPCRRPDADPSFKCTEPRSPGWEPVSNVRMCLRLQLLTHLRTAICRSMCCSCTCIRICVLDVLHARSPKRIDRRGT